MLQELLGQSMLNVVAMPLTVNEMISLQEFKLHISGWYSKTSSVASTSVGGDPGNPILLYCKTFLRQVLASTLTIENLEAIADAALYTTSIDGVGAGYLQERLILVMGQHGVDVRIIMSFSG